MSATSCVTISASSPGISTVNVTAIVTDDDIQAILVSSTSVMVGEGSNISVNVSLKYQPTASVTVNVSSAMTIVAGVTSATLTFTPGNYATAQSISISGTEDADTANSSTSVSLTLAGATPANVNVTVIDNDNIGIELNPTSLTVNEGGTSFLQVRLTAQPASSITVTLTSSDPNVVGVATPTLTFSTTNWNSYQTAIVVGAEDPDSQNGNGTISATAPGVTTKTAAVTVIDNDTATIIATPTAVSLGEGGSTTFNVHLSAPPQTGAVSVTITNPDPGAVTVSPMGLAFDSTNYQTDQQVTVSGRDDADTQNESVSLSLTLPSYIGATVTASVTDDDIQALVVSTSALTINEGNTGTFNVSLTFQPTSTVAVTLSSTNSAVAGPNVTTLMFTPTNYSTPQPVDVITVADADFDFNTAQIRVTAPGVATKLVDITVREPGIIDTIVNGNPSICINDFSSAKVRLSGNPINPITLSVTGTGKITASPTSLTFDSTNYSTYRSVIINAAGAIGTGTLTVTGPGLTMQRATYTVMNGPACQF